MKAVIVEDEKAAVEALRELIAEVTPDIEIIAVLQGVDEGVEWFGAHPSPDLVFMDIHLADGSSFTIFDHVKISCPIIFTTAYDQYALRAFEVNSVDYLLKPVDRTQLERAVNKLRGRAATNGQDDNLRVIEQLIARMRESSSFKSTLLIQVKDKLVPLPVKNIAYLYTSEKIVRAVDFDGRETIIDGTLDEVASQLDPHQFYRANRQYIVSRTAFSDMSIWFNGRLSVNLKVKTPERILVSRANAKEFKEWITE